VQPRELILTAAVIVVPLVIAVVVTLWSLEQARYRPKRRRPAPERSSTPGYGETQGEEPNA
jgi:hypothetical protein